MLNECSKITWWPDLNEGGTKSLRNYKIWGKAALDDGSDWEYPTNSLHRFFKVSVEMPSAHCDAGKPNPAAEVPRDFCGRELIFVRVGT